MNEDENTLYQKLQNATKVMLSGKFIMIDTHNKKKQTLLLKKQKLYIKKLRKYRLIPKLAEEKKSYRRSNEIETRKIEKVNKI